jgi:hypothetical protein
LTPAGGEVSVGHLAYGEKRHKLIIWRCCTGVFRCAKAGAG